MPEFKLSVATQGDTEIAMTRQFRAPRDLVFRCFTEPDLIIKWLGHGMGTTTELKVDTSIGGVWIHNMDIPGHGPFKMFGQTLEVDRPSRMVRSNALDMPHVREQITTETSEFEEVDGVTTVKILIRHLGKASRDSHAGGIEFGASQSYNALEELLVSGAL